MTQLRESTLEALSSVIPITAIVALLSVTIAPLSTGVMVLFIFGSFLLIVGMGLFTHGAEMSMQPMGEGIGIELSKSKRLALPLAACFILGVIITVAEPDLTVLAGQISAIPNLVLIFTVAAGVGAFLLLSYLRNVFRFRLSRLLLIFYAIVFIAAFLAPEDFIPAAFDSGGVTTGPITVPFIMALGVGLAAVRSDRKSADDSFGLVALCSIGPIIAVLILSILYKPSAAESSSEIADILTTRDALELFVSSIPDYCREVSIAVAPLVALFVLFQLITRRFHRHQLIRITTGMAYTYVGLVTFLTGANVGFMPAGRYLGAQIAGGDNGFLLIPVGMVMGYFIVAAEPAVAVLKKQVEDVSNGRISQKTIGRGLSVGVALSVGIAMLRILTGISVMWFLVPGYAISLAISFLVPPIYTGVAFDSGGVASGPMTTAFLLPFATGACSAVGGNMLTDAFGIVAMVAMTPLITIQFIGLYSETRKKIMQKKATAELDMVDDCIIFYDN